MVILMGDLGEVFSRTNTIEGHTETHKSLFFPYRKVSGKMVIMNDLEWRMCSYYMIYYVKNIQAVNSFKLSYQTSNCGMYLLMLHYWSRTLVAKPSFRPTINTFHFFQEQYMYLYRLCEDYIKSFDDYANFQRIT